MRCNNFVVVGILAAYVACVFESRIVWPDAVLLTVLSPLGIIQTVMGMTNFMPGKTTKYYQIKCVSIEQRLATLSFVVLLAWGCSLRESFA